MIVPIVTVVRSEPARNHESSLTGCELASAATTTAISVGHTIEPRASRKISTIGTGPLSAKPAQGPCKCLNCWNRRLMGAPRYARPFVAAFVGMLVICALVPLNLWPFSNWELFSRLRGPVETSWTAVVREPDGRTREYLIGPHTACAPLLRSAKSRFGPATGVRIYHVERLLSDRIGARAAPPDRTLVSSCTGRGVRATG